jgi:hypothetical protein
MSQQVCPCWLLLLTNSCQTDLGGRRGLCTVVNVEERQIMVTVIVDSVELP